MQIMKERFTPTNRNAKAGLAVGLGLTAALLAGCSIGGEHGGPKADASVAHAHQLKQDRNQIAELYNSCEIVEAKKVPNKARGGLSADLGHDAVRLTVNLDVNGFRAYYTGLHRAIKLPTEDGQATFNVYPLNNAGEGTGYVPYVGNTAETLQDGEVVMAAVPCGGIVKVNKDTWMPTFSPVHADEIPATKSNHLM